MKFCPERLLLVEQAENNLFEIDRELRYTWVGTDIRPYVCDITDAGRVEQIFAAEKPQVIFHAAAHKHVPMMEINPGEAIKNNVFGTKTVADAAAAENVAIAVGGRALVPELRQQMDYAAYCDNLRHLTALAKSLAPKRAATAAKKSRAKLGKNAAD